MHLSVDTIYNIIIKLLPTILLIVGIPISIYCAYNLAAKLRFETIQKPTWHFTSKNIIQRNNKKYQIKDLVAIRDPFIKEVKTQQIVKQALSPLNLSMIIINNKKRLCKINGKFYKEGEAGQDFIIKKITSEKVLIERQGKEKWLFLTQEI